AKSISFRLALESRPHSITFPDEPGGAFASLFTMALDLSTLTAPLADTDYGTVAYGQCLDTLWHEFRSFTVTYKAPIAGTTITDFTAVVSSVDPMPASGAIAPVIAPVKSPLIGGKDAFTPQTAVTTGPVLSWSAPATGTPTSYIVRIHDA